jgi:hypothetical protein
VGRLWLTKALTRRSEQLSFKGEVAALETVQRSLCEIGATTELDVELTIAESLRRHDRISEAYDRLENALHRLSGLHSVERIEAALGELAIRKGALSRARRSFEVARDRAIENHLPARAAQQHVRLGLIALLEKSYGSARSELRSALQNWSDAGAFEPTEALVNELIEVGQRTLDESAWGAIEGIVRKVLSELGVDDDTLDEVAGLLLPQSGMTSSADADPA